MRGNVVLCGNIVINTENLKNVLKKQDYYLDYKGAENKVIFTTNSGHVLFEINNIPYESAVKLAEGLGLKSLDEMSPTNWSKWNPSLELDHDDSPDADMLWMEMLKLGIPHKIYRGQKKLALYANGGGYTKPLWSTEQMLIIVRETAERYKEQLASIP